MTGARDELLVLYDSALPLVYGYLLPRCGSKALADDLTSVTFLAAVDATRSGEPPRMGVPWIIGVARNKLLDHWRHQYRDERRRRAVADDPPLVDDPWDVELDIVLAHEVLQQLEPHHRAALTLRYLDDLPVPRVAALLERSVHATEVLLVRARAAFRRAYRMPTGEESDV
ncbi:MAG TPA: sigma-70 family RNA polymerase sigma factor [Acidimicrobiales bacterium]|nr:sigma-70 family RNA polymerase sigma factor [Acidimicrobiales bacterium]